MDWRDNANGRATCCSFSASSLVSNDRLFPPRRRLTSPTASCAPGSFPSRKRAVERTIEAEEFNSRLKALEQRMSEGSDRDDASIVGETARNVEDEEEELEGPRVP